MKYNKRIRYWVQDTQEGGHWELTGLMTDKQVKTLVENRFFDGPYEIIDELEGEE